MPETTLDFDGRVANPELSQLVSDANLVLTPEERFASLLGSLLSVVMTFSAILLLLYLVWGAVEWITSGGESAKLQAARNKMLHAIIGIIVLSSVIALFALVQYILNIEIFTFPGATTTSTTTTGTGQCLQVGACPAGTLVAPAAWCGFSCSGLCCTTN